MTSIEALAAISACSVSKQYASMFQALSRSQKLEYRSDKDAISKALFYHMAKMKYAGWIHRVEFKRARKHSIADVFQDMLVFYLRCALTETVFEVVLENSEAGSDGRKTQADILILRNGRNHFIIEAKTTIGFARPDRKAVNPYHLLEQRLALVATNFRVPPENVIYVFEEPSNVSDDFCTKFWNKQRKEAAPRDNLKHPLSQIFPLFWGTDPYYWQWKEVTEKREDKRTWYPQISDDRFMAEAEQGIVTPLETVVRRILNARSAAV